MALFESYERRIDKISGVLSQYGISSVEECREICKAKGFDPYEIVKGIQPICFENACKLKSEWILHNHIIVNRHLKCRAKYPTHGLDCA